MFAHPTTKSLAVSSLPAVLAALGLAGLSAQTTTFNLNSPEAVARGNEVFHQSCAVGYCHGAQGRSARGPELRDREWQPRHLFQVTADGIPGTSMPPWKAQLSERDIWAVVSYIMSLSSTKLDDTAAVIELDAVETPRSALSEEAQRGKALFFDLTNEKRCSVCHRLGGRGAAVGPDLAASAANKSSKDVLRDITKPNSSIAKGFRQTEVNTNEGERLAGILKEETKEYVRVYDTASIPPPLRTIYRDQIHATRTRKRTSMPGDYGSLYTPEELNAIVAYLRSGEF